MLIQANLREAETVAAVEDVEIKNMELQLQRKLLEQELMREHCEAAFKSEETDRQHDIPRAVWQDGSTETFQVCYYEIKSFEFKYCVQYLRVNQEKKESFPKQLNLPI